MFNFSLSRERKKIFGFGAIDKQSMVASKRLHGNNLKFLYPRIEKLGKQIVYLQYRTGETYSSLAFLICGSGLFLAEAGSNKIDEMKVSCSFLSKPHSRSHQNSISATLENFLRENRQISFSSSDYSLSKSHKLLRAKL